MVICPSDSGRDVVQRGKRVAGESGNTKVESLGRSKQSRQLVPKYELASGEAEHRSLICIALHGYKLGSSQTLDNRRSRARPGPAPRQRVHIS